MNRQKEILAVVEGVNKYYFDLYGDQLVLETDRLPLASLKTYKNANADATHAVSYGQENEIW